MAVSWLTQGRVMLEDVCARSDHRRDEEVDAIGAGARHGCASRARDVALADVAVPRRECRAVQSYDEVDHVSASFGFVFSGLPGRSGLSA